MSIFAGATILGFLKDNWKALVIGAVVLIGVLWAWSKVNQVQTLTAEKAALSEALSASEAEAGTVRELRAADTRAVGARDTNRQTITNKETAGHAETIKALEAHPDWANQPIPDDVLDSLRQ